MSTPTTAARCLRRTAAFRAAAARLFLYDTVGRSLRAAGAALRADRSVAKLLRTRPLGRRRLVTVGPFQPRKISLPRPMWRATSCNWLVTQVSLFSVSSTPNKPRAQAEAIVIAA